VEAGERSAASGHAWREDLAELALRGWRVGRQACRTCGGYHQLWGLLRAAGMVRGLDDDAQVLGPLMRASLGERSRVLLVGAADTGVLALLMREVAPTRPRCTVIDRCAAPLELIRDYALEHGVDCELVHDDLLRWSPNRPFDLVVAHYTLSFVAPADLRAAVDALARCVAPNGHALVVLKSGRAAPDSQVADFRDAWLAEARAAIAASGLAASLDASELDALLLAHAQARTRRKAALVPVAVVREAFEHAGLEVVSEAPAGRRRRLRVQGAEDLEASVALLLRARA
jgi:hypothetical protein